MNNQSPKSTAIDIALLPPQEIIDLAKQYNSQINSQGSEDLLLDETHLPHVSLVQQFIDTDKLTDLYLAIEKTLNDFKSISLLINDIDSLKLSDGNEASYFIFQDIAEVQTLHETLMKVSEPFIAKGNKNSFILGPGEQVRPSSVEWTTDFRKKSSGQNFEAHITLGIGDKPKLKGEVSFTTDRLTVCHLGMFNTCRKILKEWRLAN